MHAASLISITTATDLTSFADLLPDLVMFIDEHGRIHHAGSACASIVGYHTSELAGHNLYEFVPEEEAPALKEALYDVPTQSSKIGLQSQFRHKDDRALQMQWSVKWLPRERLLMCIVRDITPLKGPSVMERCLAHASTPLAHYERRVLELLLTEASEKQIADRLGLTVSTTHSYVTGIFRKFRVRGRAGLMSLWIKAATEH